MLWPVLERIYDLNLLYDNSREAVKQRKEFLQKEQLGICDIVESCEREKVDASDLGMQQIVTRDLFEQISLYPSLDTLLFMGGNSKNGPEYLFRRELKKRGLSPLCYRDRVPRVHGFRYMEREIMTVSLTSPSNAANRAIGSTELYKRRKRENPDYSTLEYRMEQYKQIFIEERYRDNGYYSTTPS